MRLVGRRVWFDDNRLTLREELELSASLIVKASGPATPSSLIEVLANPVMVGASFTGDTVNSKSEVAWPPLASATVMVMVAEPKAFVMGRNATVRFAPLPLKMISAEVISSGFDESEVRVRLPVGVSTSPMVKERFVVASSFNVMLGSAEIVGSSLTGVTVTVN